MLHRLRILLDWVMAFGYSCQSPSVAASGDNLNDRVPNLFETIGTFGILTRGGGHT